MSVLKWPLKFIFFCTSVLLSPVTLLNDWLRSEPPVSMHESYFSKTTLRAVIQQATLNHWDKFSVCLILDAYIQSNQHDIDLSSIDDLQDLQKIQACIAIIVDRLTDQDIQSFVFNSSTDTIRAALNQLVAQDTVALESQLADAVEFSVPEAIVIEPIRWEKTYALWCNMQRCAALTSTVLALLLTSVICLVPLLLAGLMLGALKLLLLPFKGMVMLYQSIQFRLNTPIDVQPQNVMPVMGLSADIPQAAQRLEALNDDDSAATIGATEPQEEAGVWL